MKRAVFKYKYKDDMELPADFRVVYIGVQNDEIMVWANVPSGLEDRKNLVPTGFILLPTGISYEDQELNLVYVQTVFQQQFVWHIYRKVM